MIWLLILANFIKAILGYAFVIFAHEAGHIYYLRKFKDDNTIKINFSLRDKKIFAGTSKDYENLSILQKEKVYWGGIFAGMFVIVFFSQIDALYLIFLIPYLLSCRKDFKLLVFCHHKKSNAHEKH